MEHKKKCSAFYDNTTILIYQILCTIIIPIIILTNNRDYMHYYSFVIVCFSTLLTYSGHRDIFSNLYTDNCDSQASYISTGLINIVAFIGILFSTSHYMKINNNIFDVVLYGLVLFTFTFVVSKTILLYILKQVDSYCKNKKLVDSKQNWHKLLSGIIYLIIFLIIYILIINSFKTGILSQNNKTKSKNSIGKSILNTFKKNKPNNLPKIDSNSKTNKTNLASVNKDKVDIKIDNKASIKDNKASVDNKSNNLKTNNNQAKKITPKNLINRITINNKKNIIEKSKSK